MPRVSHAIRQKELRSVWCLLASFPDGKPLLVLIFFPVAYVRPDNKNICLHFPSHSSNGNSLWQIHSAEAMALAVTAQYKWDGRKSDAVICCATLNSSPCKLSDQVSVSNRVECFCGRALAPQPPSSHELLSSSRVLCKFSKFGGKFSVSACRSTGEKAEAKGNVKNGDMELDSTESSLKPWEESLESDDAGFAPIENAEKQSRRKKSEMEEIGEGIVQFIRPIIQVLNGSTLRQANKEGSASKRNNMLLSFSKAFVRIVSGSAWTDSNKNEIGNMFRKAEADFFKCTSHVGRYLLTMMSTGAILAIAFELSGGDSEMNTLIWSSWLAGVIVGTMIGANQVLEQHCKSGPRTVVITGSTRGLGKALAREFLLAGDHVVIASRSAESVSMTVAQLQQELTEGILTTKVGRAVTRNRKGKVVGIPCDVSRVKDVKLLAEFAVSEFGSIDIWINNAGMSKGFRPLLQFTDDEIDQVVSTNLIGSLICTREAIRIMKLQAKGGHVFNMDGAGSGGSSTPLTAVYGSTKCGLRQLHASLLEECKRSKVGIHTASPGMVLTDLLISGASLQNKKMFNIICELPETVARKLVPRMRAVKGTGKAINFLTPPRILFALVTAWLRRGRWFDEEGRALYAAEADRVRNWAEARARFSFSDAVDFYSDSTWVSVFSLSVVCAFIILSSSGNGMSGT